MTPDRWREIERVYQLAKEQPEDQRSAFLRATCGNDQDLLREVVSLLSQSDGAEHFLLTGVRHAAAEAPAEFFIGQYKILGELGRGGMGVVYCGVDPRIGRRVAIKTIQWDPAVDPRTAELLQSQFFQEARSVGNLSHPNIVTFYHVGEHQGRPFIAMEFIDGAPLQKVMRPWPADPAQQQWILNGLRQIALALDFAHSKNIIHRDVKPGNILVGKDQVFKIADFGIAKIIHPDITTTMGYAVGTPSYISPEQLRGESASARSDQYSFAVTAFQALTGRLPFSANPPEALIYKVLSEPVPAASSINQHLPPAVDQVFRRVLSKNPAERFNTCLDFVRILAGTLAPDNVPGRMPAPRPAPPPPAPAKPPIEVRASPRRASNSWKPPRRIILPGIICIVSLVLLQITQLLHKTPFTQRLSLEERIPIDLSGGLPPPPESPALPAAFDSGPPLFPAPEAEITGPVNPHFLQRIWAPGRITLRLIGIAANDTMFIGGENHLWAVQNGTLRWGYSSSKFGDWWVSPDGRLWSNGGYGFNSLGQGGLLPSAQPGPGPHIAGDPGDDNRERGCDSAAHSGGQALIRSFRSLDQECRMAAPAPNGDLYVVTLARTLYRLDPAGRILWTYRAPCDIPFLKTTLPGLVVMGCRDEYLYGIRDGKLEWQFKAGNPISGDVWNYQSLGILQDRQGTVFFTDRGSDGRVYAVDSQGKLLWQFELDNFTLPNAMALLIDRRKRLYLMGSDNSRKLAGEPVEEIVQVTE